MTRADIADLLGWVNPKDSDLLDRIERIVRLAEAAEREACARLCDEIEETCWESWDTQCDPLDQGSAIGAAHCAAAIRARDNV